MLIHDAKNTQPITELYVYISVDKNGNEGVCGATLPDLGSVPLVFGYLKTAEAFLSLVNEVVATTGVRVDLVKFTNREVLKSIGGE